MKTIYYDGKRYELYEKDKNVLLRDAETKEVYWCDCHNGFRCNVFTSYLGIADDGSKKEFYQCHCCRSIYVYDEKRG